MKRCWTQLLTWRKIYDIVYSWFRAQTTSAKVVEWIQNFETVPVYPADKSQYEIVGFPGYDLLLYFSQQLKK